MSSHRDDRLDKDFRAALGAGQFKVYFQPIVEMASRRVLKAEALLRWSHPEWSALSPKDLIGMAQRMGLTNEIEDWVFRESARWARRWSDRFGADFQVSVNVSGRQFESDGDAYVDGWNGHLQELGLPASTIIIEMTGEPFARANQVVINKLVKLHALGIQFALDDFGTGYSSLSYVKSSPLDFLKIHETFIHSVDTNTNAKEILKAIIALARSLRLSVVADGVRTLAEHQFLSTLGCGYAQGDLYSQPVLPEQFEALAESR
jgi:EAL domain-containing protein (putative c-di-GMP-specific phosphodiesterase class I)